MSKRAISRKAPCNTATVWCNSVPVKNSVHLFVFFFLERVNTQWPVVLLISQRYSVSHPATSWHPAKTPLLSVDNSGEATSAVPSDPRSLTHYDSVSTAKPGNKSRNSAISCAIVIPLLCGLLVATQEKQ